MKRLLIFMVAILGLVSLSPAPAVSALTPEEKKANCLEDNSTFFGLPNWYKYLEKDFEDDVCEVQFTAVDKTLDDGTVIKSDIPKVLLAVFEIILRVGGMVAVVFVIVGGVQYTISQGEPDKTKAARQTIINALVGLFIALMAVSIVNLIGGVVT